MSISHNPGLKRPIASRSIDSYTKVMISEYQKLVRDTLLFLKQGKPLPKKKLIQELLPPPKPQPVKVEAPPPPEPKIIPKPEKKEVKSSAIPLNKPNPPTYFPNPKMKELFESLSCPYLEQIPKDTIAKRIKESWKQTQFTPDIPILYSGKQYRPFLENIAKAITVRFAPSHVVDIGPLEQQQKWDLFLKAKNLKLIIAPDFILWGAKHLMPYYKEYPQEKKRFIGHVPLLLLPDPSLYLKDPSLKRSLWNVICNSL